MESFMSETVELIRRTTLFVAGTGAIFAGFLAAVHILS
jgi:hypothetical protein